MADDYAKERLAGYLDEYVYRPILSRTPDDFEPSFRPMLAEVQVALRAQLAELHDAPSAAMVLSRFQAVAAGAEGDEIRRKMKELGLPLPAPAIDGFEELARNLDVTPSS